MKSLCFDKTAVMGILNVTPDSFSDGGQFQTAEAALTRALAMQTDGAAIIDIGAQSTRPGATPITPEEEWARLSPVLDILKGQLTCLLSVDTFEPTVAKRALKNGVQMLNDVSGSETNDFPFIAAAHGAALVMMARDAEHTDDVAQYFDRALALAAKAGLSFDNVLLDIGVGFHKSREVDLAVIAALPRLTKDLPCAVLCGASRKRVIPYAADADIPVNERLSGTLALHTAAQLGGAAVLRVHDVKDAVQAAAVIDKLMKKRSFES